MLLYLDCPCTSFPRSFARDYKETYRYPPPSTVYGLLLSLVGEVDMMAHIGVKLGIGIIGDDPPISRIVRKQRHHKFSVKHLGTYPTSQFSKPNHHELLTDLQVVIQLDSSEESAAVKLSDLVAIALSTPGQISRFGGLSLGESWALINGARLYREADGVVRWLVKDNRGLIGLPVWIDRQTTQGTFQRFSMSELGYSDECLISIKPPVTTAPAKSAQAKRGKRST
ncbi:CRISPR-associated protein Cas5 [Leptolyngbya sp. FACHB-36]|uniref:CRISPR-associated protein Cas5 n=1 Tax=Leptolyngbya sp. FACHB-36 TaxID=2692808 RepID=UPI0016819FD1|nr:CRISPR-associated protein Cas5 [Leptolyngbya sp. FACHB-36]MBD2019220.1 CRISPR-associated protein Cas5 [Leptolyngbya sp. FACHB-36]